MPELGLAGGERERECVEDQQLGCEAKLTRRHLVDASRHLQLALRGLGHALLVDGQRDHRGAVAHHQWHDRIDSFAAVLEVDRVDDRAAGIRLERRLDHAGLGGIDAQRRFDRQRQALDQAPHLVRLVGALGERHAHVQRVAPPSTCWRAIGTSASI
jgi:hypothetical protein